MVGKIQFFDCHFDLNMGYNIDFNPQLKKKDKYIVLTYIRIMI